MKDEQIKILMIEDNPGDARLIREMLKEIDTIHFDVKHTSRLDEGLKYIVMESFDVVLLDLCLPDSKGIDTFKIMIYNAPNLPIIVLTGLKDDIFAVNAVRRGAQDYLVKGEVNGKILVRSIKYAIERKRIEKELDELAKRYHLAQKAGEIGTFDWNIQKDEILWNEELEKIYGLSVDSFGGKYENWIQLLYPEDRERVDEEIKRSIKNQTEWNDFFRITWPDKSIHWIKAQAMTFYNDESLPLRMIGVNYDVTDMI
jgi:two-component system, cell cycle sensor histidine kinase and response regulator CckA